MRCFDVQVNGAFGVDFSAPDLTGDQFLRTAEKILQAGVTRFLPTVITSSMAVYQKNLPCIVKAVEKAGLTYEIPGFHLEGPFISGEPGAVGAHPKECVLPATLENLQNLYELADGKVLLMTIAAELPGANELAEQASKMNICISLGHQLANGEQIRQISSAKALTHLGNGIPNMINRHHNPIWSGLADDKLTALFITDGHHLPAEVIQCFIRCKGADKLIVTSDASSAAGLPPGRYSVLGNDAVLDVSGKLYNPEKQCLVGSASLMPQCIQFLKNLQLVSDDELEKMVWYNPHQLLGMQLSV